MRLKIVAVGRARPGPAHELARLYLDRAAAAGPKLGFSSIEHAFVQGRPVGDKAAEANALRKAAPEQAARILLDENGRDLSSRAFSGALARWRDEGRPSAVFWIGGADGTDASLAGEADLTLAFGRQTWPHELVPALLAEQIYRALMILSGNPYHRD